LQSSRADTRYGSQIFKVNNASRIFLDETLDATHKEWRDRRCRGL
jgi:hypothetical protein